MGVLCCDLTMQLTTVLHQALHSNGYISGRILTRHIVKGLGIEAGGPVSAGRAHGAAAGARLESGSATLDIATRLKTLV